MSNLTPRHIYVFALGRTVLDDLRREISSTLSTTEQGYIPKIKVNDALHGIAKIELINFRESAVLIPCWSFQIEIGGITSSQIELIDNNTNNQNNHSIQEIGSDCKIFEFGVDSLEMEGVVIDEIHRLINLSNIDHNARIYIRFPVFLNSYSVSVRVRCKLLTSNEWSDWTKKHKINISSSMITRDFNINEKILFNPTHSNHSIPGKIKKIMDEEKKIYQIETGVIRPKIWNDIHFNRIFKNGPLLKNIIIDIDRITQTHINKQLLFGTYCIDQYDIIFHTLSDIYEQYAENLCVEHKFESIKDIDCTFIGRFITNHVMDFLFDINENELKYNTLKCIFDNCNHGLMQIVPVWHSSLINHIQLLNYHKDSDLIVINPSEMNIKFSCNLCGVEISSYEWIFKCDGCDNVLNKHFICLICGFNIIRQYKKIQNILHEYLNKYDLYTDCINLITEFVCGSVVSL